MWTGVNIFAMTSSLNPRSAYHHGDLRNALIAAGAKLAEQGGPEAVGIRAAAREVGVTPTAAYRHFANADDLRDAVRGDCMAVLTAGMRSELAALDETGDRVQDAVRRFIALGRGYISVALANPGMFRAAFGGEQGGVAEDFQEKRIHLAEVPPFAMLSAALDDLVEVGYLPAQRRELAELGAWSAAHGLSRLIIDGPLRALNADEREAAIERTLTMVAEGL